MRATRRSRAGEALLQRYYQSHSTAPGELELFGAIVAEFARLVKVRYDAPFTVLLWGTGQRSEEVLAELRKRGLTVLKISDWIPRDRISDFVIHSKYDWHPNAAAYEIVARHLAAFVLEPRTQPNGS